MQQKTNRRNFFTVSNTAKRRKRVIAKCLAKSSQVAFNKKRLTIAQVLQVDGYK